MIPSIVLDPTGIVPVCRGSRSTTSGGTGKLTKLMAGGGSRGGGLEVMLACAASTGEAFADCSSMLL